MRLAIDIGGTFTDLVLEKNKTLFSKKVLTSVDKPERAVVDGVLELLSENLKRCGLKADVILSDAFNIIDKFDIVLLDAPCSATGTIRRHPDLVYCKDGSDFSELFEIQAKLLDHASSIVKDDGLIIYVTCSLLPDEGECQIEEFLGRNAQFEIKNPQFNYS